jgi:hypothetical protein
MVEFVSMFAVEGVTYIYSQIDYPSILEFVSMFAVEGVTYIY